MNANKLFWVFMKLTFAIFVVLVAVMELFKHQIVGLMTNIEEVKSEVMAVFFLLQLNTLPDLYKGVFNGTI